MINSSFGHPFLDSLAALAGELDLSKEEDKALYDDAKLILEIGSSASIGQRHREQLAPQQIDKIKRHLGRA